MFKTFLPHKKRRIQILELASRQYGCLCNAEWCSALTNEPDMKWLLKRNYVVLRRIKQYGFFARVPHGKTMAFITEKGKNFLNNSKK